MTMQKFIDYCLTKKEAYLDFPFGEDVCVVKVRKKIFAQAFRLKGVETVTLNCTAEAGQLYRAMFEDIVVRGYHCPPIQQPYFNSMPLDVLKDEILTEMIDESYTTVVKKLPKYIQTEIFGAY